MKIQLGDFYSSIHNPDYYFEVIEIAEDRHFYTSWRIDTGKNAENRAYGPELEYCTEYQKLSDDVLLDWKGRSL